MGFGDAPNANPGFENNENEPQIEEQEGLSDFFGEQAESRLRDIEEIPVRMDKKNRPAGLGGLDAYSQIHRPRKKAQQAYLNELGTLQEQNAGRGIPTENTEQQALSRTENQMRKKFHNKSVGSNEQDSEQEAEKKVQQMQEALAPVIQELGLDETKDPFAQLFDFYNSSKDNERIVREALARHLPAREADEFIRRLRSEEVRQAREEVAAAEMHQQVFQENRAIFRQMIDAEDPDDFIEKNKDKVKAFRDYIDEQEEREQLWQKAQERRELEHADSALKEAAPKALSAAATVMLLEFGVNSDVLSQLPPEGVSAVESVASRGGGRMLGALLANGVSLNDEAFTGRVSGQFVSLDFAEGDLFLTGENAADRANQSEYRIDPPTLAGFERVLIHSIGEQNRMPFIANHGAQARAMYEEFAGSTEDEALPRQEGIDGFRNFLVLLIGEGGPGEAEEEERLRDLGILDAHGTVNRSRMQLFRQALERYVPSGIVMHEGESPVAGSSESPGFAFEDAVTLARLWDKDRLRFPESLSELKKLTQIRLEGGDIHGAQYI